MNARTVAALLALSTSAGTLAAQMQPMAPPPPARPLSLQITGGMTIPVFSYKDFTDDIGWTAQGALVMRRGPFNHVRVEGEYNSVAWEAPGLSGGSEVYGGGIGGGRVVIKGNVQSEGYLVLGAYNNNIAVCTPTCVEDSEVQFGTKVGFNAVMGRGRAHPVIDFHWLSTWSAPYVNMITLSAGLRF